MWVCIGILAVVVGTSVGIWAAHTEMSAKKKILVVSVAAICAVLVFYAPFGYQKDKAKQKQEGKKSDSIDLSDEERHKIVTDIVEALEPELSERHPDGYAAFGIAKEGFLVPFGYIHPGFDIDWKTGGITSITEKYVEGVLPDIKINLPTSEGRITNCEFALSKRIGHNFSFGFGDARSLTLEVAAVYKDIVVAILYTSAAKRK